MDAKEKAPGLPAARLGVRDWGGEGDASVGRLCEQKGENAEAVGVTKRGWLCARFCPEWDFRKTQECRVLLGCSWNGEEEEAPCNQATVVTRTERQC